VSPKPDINQTWWEQFLKRRYGPIIFLLIAGGINDNDILKKVILILGHVKPSSVEPQLSRELAKLEKEGLCVRTDLGVVLGNLGKEISQDQDRGKQIVDKLFPAQKSVLEKFLKKEVLPEPSSSKEIKSKDLSELIEVPSTISPFINSVSQDSEVIEFILCMRETGKKFRIRALRILDIGRIATYLAGLLMPQLMNQGYEWSLEFNNIQLSGEQTLLTAGISNGNEVFLNGNHMRPKIRPFETI